MKMIQRPVIVGVGQFTNRSYDASDIKEPLEMIEIAIKEAEKDIGVAGLSKKIDSLSVVNILSASYPNPAQMLAERIGAHPSTLSYTWVGAAAPQWLINRAAEGIAKGFCRLVLVCGGEAFHSRRLASKMGRRKAWNWEFPEKSPAMVGDLRDPLTPLELRYGMVLPIHIYPLFENALRHQEGLSLDQHRKELGDFCSKLSKIAAENSYSWFRETQETDDIISPSSRNRMICYPYTKSMCSIMEVDQAAALFMTDEETARGLGIPREKWVYLLGFGDASDIWYVSERIDFHSSPSVKVAAQMAMEQAGVLMDEIEYLDLYSCFPCAPRITRNMLGLSKDDPRPLTLTGGMPCFGGPGNNYALHAVCRMVEVLRHNPLKFGMVQALSWFISKHSFGIYSGMPPKGQWGLIDPTPYQKALQKLSGPQIVEEAIGKASVETYTVVHNREGDPISSIIIGRLGDGRRFLARAEGDEEILREMTTRELIGETGRVRNQQGENVFVFS